MRQRRPRLTNGGGHKLLDDFRQKHRNDRSRPDRRHGGGHLGIDIGGGFPFAGMPGLAAENHRAVDRSSCRNGRRPDRLHQHGNVPCHLRGWPALTAITAQDETSTAIDRITTMFGPDLRTAPLVTLRHGATAEAVFTGGDNPGPGQTTCPPSYRLLRVIPPGSSRPVTLPAWIGYYNHDLPACTPIWVSEVVPYADLYQGRQGK